MCTWGDFPAAGTVTSAVPTMFGTEPPAVATARGQQWTAVVTPYDAVGPGEPGLWSVTVMNSPPGAPTLAIEPAQPLADVDALLCAVTDEAPDPDDDPILYTITWTHDGAPYG